MPSKRTLAIPTPQQLSTLPRKMLYIGRRNRDNRGCERGQVEVGGGIGVEGIDVDGAPVGLGCGHCG